MPNADTNGGFVKDCLRLHKLTMLGLLQGRRWPDGNSNQK